MIKDTLREQPSFCREKSELQKSKSELRRSRNELRKSKSESLAFEVCCDQSIFTKNLP